MPKIDNTETEQPKVEAAIGNAIVADIDGDGTLEINPDKAQETLVELVTLDHELRDHGLSVADLLKAVADKTFGIRV